MQAGIVDMQPNVRRYVALAQSRGGACFCTRGAMQDYDVVLFILALAKTVTPAGAPGGSRGGLCRCTLNVPFWLESSRGAERLCHIPTCYALCHFFDIQVKVVFLFLAFESAT